MLHILSKDDFAIHKQASELMMSLFVLLQHALGTFVLFGDECFHFVVDEFSSLLAIRLLPLLLT